MLLPQLWMQARRLKFVWAVRPEQAFPLESRQRIPQIAKAAASSPFLPSIPDRSAKTGRPECFRELVPPEMRPDSLRPD
jgi:hypothetical protein